jgi:lipoprotein-anchoring transpeptidase ErfK/SrfK
MRRVQGAVSVGAAFVAVATLAAPGLAGRAGQRVAALRHSTTAFVTPGGRALAAVPAVRPITGEQTTLPVTATRRLAGRYWLQVELPGRPNGRRGWIRLAAARLASTQWRLVVDRTQRRLTVLQGAHVVRVFPAIVGKPSTPTPRGAFFVEEVVALPASAAGAPVALARSARSDVLQEFEGGPGQIAIHGTQNVGGTLGTAVSHGCVRVSTAAVEWLSLHIGPGTPVTIR